MNRLTLASTIATLSTILTLNHAAITLNSAGTNIHAAYLKTCDPETVKLKKTTFLDFPLEVKVEGRNCAGPDSKGQKYIAQIWDHVFWVL